MGHSWEAHWQVDATRASQLVSRAYPELGGLSVSDLGSGWDNFVFRFGADWVFRFARHPAGADRLAVERTLLPLLRSALPLDVPDVRYFAVGDGADDTSFAGYPYLAGAPAVGMTDSERVSVAPSLGRFLRALHALPRPAAWDGDGPYRSRRSFLRPMRRVLRSFTFVPVAALLRGTSRATYRTQRIAWGQRRADTVQRLRALERRGVLGRVRPLERRLAAPRSPRSRCLVHGDFNARHLLVSGSKLTGVIDWGQAHWGDRASDLGIAWSFLPAEARPAFEAAYGRIDRATRTRAIAGAIHRHSTLAEYALQVGDDDVSTASFGALARLAAI